VVDVRGPGSMMSADGGFFRRIVFTLAVKAMARNEVSVLKSRRYRIMRKRESNRLKLVKFCQCTFDVAFLLTNFKLFFRGCAAS